ncbi:hypothetical protein KCP73_13450 [Salmonella enterica subsp. enterica]|nr:hypothetical protein KCP73_13450 [Salmonella enterica subsp. enterica]
MAVFDDNGQIDKNGRYREKSPHFTNMGYWDLVCRLCWTQLPHITNGSSVAEMAGKAAMNMAFCRSLYHAPSG